MPRFKLVKQDDGTARVVSPDGQPLTLDGPEGAEPEAVTVVLDGFQAVAPDPLAGLEDNPAVREMKSRLEKAEAALANQVKAAHTAKIQADAAAFHRDLTDGKAPRMVGKLAQDAQRVFSQTGPGRLVLITCEDWNGSGYDSNAIVFAERLTGPA